MKMSACSWYSTPEVANDNSGSGSKPARAARGRGSSASLDKMGNSAGALYTNGGGMQRCRVHAAHLPGASKCRTATCTCERWGQKGWWIKLRLGWWVGGKSRQKRSHWQWR